jgi:dTDP-4-dehydrorhamnose 3,5-epimerase
VKVVPCAIPDVLMVEPQVYRDSRGAFLETYNERTFAALGFHHHYVQDNLSMSKRNVIRGLHYQVRHPQGKLVQAIRGEVLDVAVDLRRWSPTFGEHVAVRLSDQDYKALWIPPGFAHGFAVLSEGACFAYKATDFYAPEFERTIVWNDPEMGIDWGVKSENAIVSQKDRAGALFSQAEVYEDEAVLIAAGQGL